MTKYFAILLILLLTVFPVSSFRTWAGTPVAESKKSEKAKKKEIRKVLSQAKASLKQGKDLQNVEKSLNTLLNDTSNVRDERIHLLLFQCLEMQYQQGNEKLFLKQKYDTATLFLTARKMFLAFEKFDSVDALNMESGRAFPKYRREHSQKLVPYYHNLYTGGIYFFNHKKYDDALKCSETFLSAPHWPLFSSVRLQADSSVVNHASYLSFMSSYKTGDSQRALKYKDSAKRHIPRLESTLQCLCEIYQKENMEEDYLSALQTGVDSFPTSTYFFPRLVDLYCEDGKYDTALSLTEKVIASDTTNLLLHVTRQTLLLNLARYQECVDEGLRIISVNDSISEAHYNIALAYYNQALEKDIELKKKPRERTKQVNALYRKCLPYMQRYRSLAPEQRDRWRPVLYDIYLNLNMGKEFEEIVEQ